MATDLFAKNASLVDTSAASRIAQNTNAANNPVKVNVSPTEQQFNDYRDAVTTYWTAEETERQWNNAISKQKSQRQSIIDLYNQFYTSGSYYDANGKLVTDQNPYDYADRLQFAEYLHSLYPELSVDYFMQNAEAFMEEATGVKGDISSYSQHIGNIWDATWASTGLAVKTFGNYIYYGLNGGFGTQEWENKKQELAQDRATSGANYRKDLGDEKYDSLIQKMISGTVEQSPQIAMMLGQMALTAATGGFAGALSAGYLINDATAKGVLKAGQWAGRAANFAFSALTEAGNSMLDCYQNGFSDDTSLAVGLATGLFTGALETWGDDQLLKPLNDAVEAVVGLNDGKVMKEAVQSFGQWCADHAVKTAKNVGASLVTEPAEEEVELLAGTLIENIAASVERLHGRDVTGGKDWNEFWSEAKDTLVQTLLSTPLMTLAGGAAGTGIEILGGNGSMQWTPSAYMNREGATSVIANGNIVSDTIKQSKTKTDTKGKADPIKAHTIGNQVFIDEELSPKQYEAIKNKKAVYITDTEASKLITTPRAQLDNDAITVDATLTANEAQNFLSKAEEDGKLKGYGFATEEGAISRTLKKAKGDNGLSEQNGGDATILYMEIEGVDNPIKIQIEEEEKKDSKAGTKYETEKTEPKKNEELSVQDQFIKNIEREGEVKTEATQTEEVDEDPFAELQDITGIKYKEFETLTARSEKIRKKRQQEAQKKKQDKKQAKKDTKAASTTENTTQTAQTTTQQTTEAKPQTDIIAEIEAQKAAKNQPEQQATTAPQAATQQAADTTKKYDVKKAEFPSKYLRENSNTPIEVAEYLDKDGNVLPEGTKGEYLALTDPNGNTKVVNVKDVKESTLNKILSNAKNSGVDKNTANKTYAKEKNASKKQAQTTVGITPDEGKSVQTVSQKEESDKKTIASKAEKVKNAGSVYNIKTFFPNMGVTDADGVPVRGASDLDYQFKGTYELVNEKGETVDNLEDAKAFIGTDTDGKEYVFKMGELNKEDFEYFVDEATQIKTTPTEAANTITEQQYTKKVNEVQKDSGTDRDTAENAVLATVSVKNALEQQGVKLSLDDAVNKLKEKGAIKNFENAKNLTQSVRAISETLFAMDGADSVLSELFDEQGVTEKITPKTFAKLFHAYLRNDENIDFTENQILFFEELKDGLLAQYENTSTTLTSEQQQEKKAIEEGNVTHQDSLNEIQNDINATRVETEKISSPFKYNKDTQQYFFDSVGAYNNIREVMIAENGGDLSNIEQIENDAKLGAIFLSSLAPDVQDKIIKRSIDSSKQSKDLNNGAKSNLLRLFFSADEYTGEIGETSRMKGASLTRSAKILLTEHSDESTVVHEVGHVAWHVDSSFRDRAKTEYGKYFQEDENGVGIRTVVEASPDRFGGMTANEVVEALKYLAGIDIVNPNDFEIDSEDYFWAVDKEKKLKKNAEEAVMYMFEAYRDGRDTVEYSKGIKGLFERLAQFIKDVADKIKEHYGVDILHTSNTAIYSPLFENESDYREYSEDTANVVVNYIDSILHTSRNNQAVRRLVISEDGNTEIWEGGDSLIITHSLSETNLLKQLEDDGKMPAISLAVKKPDTTTFVSSGSITLVGDAKMAQRVAENGELYNGDIYSAMYPETYQDTLSKNFFDKLEEKVRSIEGIDDSTLERLLNEVDILRNLIKGEDFSQEDAETLRNSRNFIDIFRAIEGIGKADKAEYMPKNYDSSAFKKFGKGFEDYYFDTLVDIYKENNGKFFPAAVAHRLRAVVTAELYPEIASFLDISDIDAVNNYYEDMLLDDQMKVDSALHDIRMGSDIFSKFENAVRSYYMASGGWKNPKDLLESIRYEARRTYLMNGKEATAENVQEEVNSKRVKNAAPIGTETEYRVLALKKLLSLSEVHENENRLNNEAGDFGNSKQTTEFKTLFDNEEKELGYAVLAYGNGNIGSEIKQKNSGYDVLKFALDTLNKTSPQGDVEQLESPLGEYLANNYNIPLERRDLVVSMVTSSIQKLWNNAAKMDAPYFEAKKREILNISDFKIAFVGNWASEGIIKALEAKGLKVFVYDDSLFLQDGWKEELGKLVKKVTSSIEGDAEQVMFQTMGKVVDGLKNEKDKDYTESQIRFEEQVYKYINSKVDFSNSFIDQWRAKNLDTFVDDNALQDLQNQLQNSGLFEVIDNQLNLSEQTANYIKKHVTERIAYEGEDYVTFADKIGEKLKKLSNRDGYVREYTDAVKDALYLLYGYRADVPGKKKQNNKRATGIFSKSFMNGGARVGVAMDSLTKKFMSAKKVLEEKGMKFTLTEKDIKTFLNPAEWKANAKDGTQLFKYGSDMSASGLEFKLAEKGLSTQKLAEFLSLTVSQTEDGYIPIAWRENDEAGISPVQGPLIDALNYAHKTDTGTLTSKTPKGFSQNSYNDAEEGYLTAAYNKFAERNIPLTEGTLSSSAILLDQYKADYLSAIEVLNGKEGMNDIFGKEINVDAIEEMKKEAGERITATREQVAEVEEINELFQKEILTERGLLQQLGDIITSIENDSKNGISISKESFQRLSDLIKQIGEKKDNKSTARINSLDAKLTAQKKSAAEKREAQKAAFDKKLEKVNKENKDKIENIEKKNDEKIQKLNEKNDKKEKRLNERIENLILKNKVLTDARETVRQKANALFKSVFDPEHNAKIGGVDKDTATAIEHVLDLLKDLRKENENLVKEKEQLAAETTAINERLKSKLGIEVATAKDFDNAGVLPIFRAGVKELRSVAANSGTAEIRERLGNILDAFTNPSNLGTDLYIGEIFNGQDLYSSTNTKNYLKYKNDFDELRTWLYDNMGARKGPMNVITIVKTINQLNTRQLAEFIDHVNKVSKDSKNYFAEMTEKENQYYDTWEDTIVSEIEQFAKLKGKDISQLTDEDALGTKGAKDVLSGGVGKLLSEFALQSVKYRDRFPTLYAYIFGGIDHEGKVYGGLNGAANAVDENFRKDVDDINKLVISKLNGTQFVKGELTDKNLRRKWNEVKNYFKTQLGEAEFDDDAKQKIGYRIDTFRDSEGILRYEVEVDEKSDSAMKEVAKYLGKQEIQKRRTQDKLKSLMKSITKTQDRILTNEDTIGRAESDIEYWKKAKVWVSGAKFGQPVTEEDRNAQIKRLTERVASVTDTLQRNREVLERKEEKVPILKERIAAFDKIGKRPNENMAKYTTQELLSIYMYAKQEGGINRLVYSPTQEGNAASSNTNNLDIGNIIWVIKQFEENEEYAPLRELADELSVIASRNFEAVRKTKFFLSNGQVLLDPIEHYFSFVADTSEMYNFGQEVDLGGFDKPAEGKTTKDSRRAKASDVMTQEREPNVVRGLNLSVLDRAYSSMYQQEYYISMGEKIESLKRLLSNDKFQTAFKDYYGRNKGVQNLKSLGKYVNSLSNTQRDFDNSAVSGIVRFFTNNTAVGAMAFSLPTVLQQMPTMLWCLKDPHIGLKGVLTALHRATTDKSLYGLSPQMQERANSAIQSIRATKNLGSAFSAKFNNYTIEQAITMTQDAGLWLLEKADNYIANAMWYATFEGVRSEYEALDDNNAKKQQFLALSADEQEQLIANEATQRVLDISPVQGGKDNAAAYSTSNAYIRQLLLFTNQTTKMLNGIVGGFRDVDVKGKTYLARILAVSIATLMLNGIINGKMWRKTTDDDDDEAKVNILKNIPYVLWEGVTDLIPGLDSILSDDRYGTTSIPSDLENIMTVFKKDPDTRTENQMMNAWANLLTDIMSTSGLAGNQARRFYRAFRDKNILQAYNSKYGELAN